MQGGTFFLIYFKNFYCRACLVYMFLWYTSTFYSDGPFLQKLGQFETSQAPFTGTTRNTHILIGGEGVLDKDGVKLTDLFCANLNTRFEDTPRGLIKSMSVANFKLCPDIEENLEGCNISLSYLIWPLVVLKDSSLLEINNIFLMTGLDGDMIKDLVDHFGCYLDDVDQIKAEWSLLKNAVLKCKHR